MDSATLTNLAVSSGRTNKSPSPPSSSLLPLPLPSASPSKPWSLSFSATGSTIFQAMGTHGFASLPDLEDSSSSDLAASSSSPQITAAPIELRPHARSVLKSASLYKLSSSGIKGSGISDNLLLPHSKGQKESELNLPHLRSQQFQHRPNLKQESEIEVQRQDGRKSVFTTPNGKSNIQPPYHKRAGASSGPVAEGYPACDNIGNLMLSCFPQSGTALTQDIWSKFIWNSNYPSFVINGYVDAYLFRADSETIAANWTNQPNDSGMIPIQPQDQWWSSDPTAAILPLGDNATYSYYFVIVPHGSTLSGGEVHQSTFSAVQTMPPTTILASLSSESIASASRASISSASAAASASSNQDPKPTGGSLQDGASTEGGFPRWAIALIAILGFFVLLLILLLLFFLLIRNRRQKRGEVLEGDPSLPHQETLQKYSILPVVGGSVVAPILSRESQAGDSALKANRDSSGSHPTIYSGSQITSADLIARQRPVSAVRGFGTDQEGASASSISEGPIISGIQAAAVADAFRAAMRKPDFTRPEEESDTPESEATNPTQTHSQFLAQELKGEGLGLKAVDKRRSYHLEGDESVHEGDETHHT